MLKHPSLILTAGRYGAEPRPAAAPNSATLLTLTGGPGRIRDGERAALGRAPGPCAGLAEGELLLAPEPGESALCVTRSTCLAY